jgi:hypothetical protein
MGPDPDRLDKDMSFGAVRDSVVIREQREMRGIIDAIIH